MRKLLISLLLAWAAGLSAQTIEDNSLHTVGRIEATSGWMQSNVTTSNSGKMYIYNKNRNEIGSLQNGKLVITDTLEVINQLINSYQVLDGLLKSTQLDLYNEQYNNYNKNQAILKVLRDGDLARKKIYAEYIKKIKALKP